MTRSRAGQGGDKAVLSVAREAGAAGLRREHTHVELAIAAGREAHRRAGGVESMDDVAASDDSVFFGDKLGAGRAIRRRVGAERLEREVTAVDGVNELEPPLGVA